MEGRNQEQTGEMFLFYKSWYENVMMNVKSKKSQTAVILAIIEFAFTGNRTFPCEKLFLSQVYDQIEIQQAKHAERVEAGKKGGKAGKGVTRNGGNRNAASKTIANNSKTIANNSETIPYNITKNKHNINACSLLEQDTSRRASCSNEQGDYSDVIIDAPEDTPISQIDWGD